MDPDDEQPQSEADYVVVGGGVAGVCVVEELNDLLENGEVPGTSHHRIVFITGAEGFVKRVANPRQIGQVTMAFDVESSDPSEHFRSDRIEVIQEAVASWNHEHKTVRTRSGRNVSYQKLAIATGASPKHSLPSHPNVFRLRDIQTIAELERKLRGARRVLIVGNGGIATELAFELKNIEIIWAMRHSSISATYFDIAAAKFFEPKLVEGRQEDDQKPEVRADRFTRIMSRLSSDIEAREDGTHCEREEQSGSALGPHWLARLAQDSSKKGLRNIHLIGEVELLEFAEQRPIGIDHHRLPDSFLPEDINWLLWAKLSNGKWLGCDLIIEATGVVPNSQIWKRDCPELKLAEDGGILVDERMMTNVNDVFAAGDVCTAGWVKESTHWKQIRLWTQARQMGMFCARCMLISDVLLDIAFDLFSHVTTFFGYKVVLLGDFAGDQLTKPFEKNYRITEGLEYVKVLTKDHRVHGAVLIGETELEEALENLILNQTDISQIEEHFLDPDIDLEDFFD